MDLDPKTDLSFTRTLAVPRKLVWECWTSPEHIPHFFVPRPHKVLSVDIDLKVGGRFKLSTLIQKRLAALNAGARPLVDVNTHEKMEIVVQEILQDKIYLDASNVVRTRPENPNLGGPPTLDLSSL